MCNRYLFGNNQIPSKISKIAKVSWEILCQCVSSYQFLASLHFEKLSRMSFLTFLSRLLWNWFIILMVSIFCRPDTPRITTRVPTTSLSFFKRGLMTRWWREQRKWWYKSTGVKISLKDFPITVADENFKINQIWWNIKKTLDSPQKASVGTVRRDKPLYSVQNMITYRLCFTPNRNCFELFHIENNINFIVEQLKQCWGGNKIQNFPFWKFWGHSKVIEPRGTYFEKPIRIVDLENILSIIVVLSNSKLFFL